MQRNGRIGRATTTRLRSLVVAAAVVAAALAVPQVLSEYNLRLMVLALQAAIAVVGLCIAFGWAGLIQLGQAAFIGIGAYTSAVLALHYGLGFWITMPLAMAASALVALAIAVPMLRLRGHYLALATVGFNVTAVIVAKNWGTLTGGEDGLGSIPGVGLFGVAIESDLGYYYLTLGFLVATAAFAWSCRHSRFGRAMIAVRDDEIASATSGVPVVRTKVLAFVIASALAGLSGSLYAHYAHYVSPGDFELSRSVTILVMLIVGGETSIAGAIVGALLIGFAPEWLRFVGEAYPAVFGVAVLLVLIAMPEGIVGKLARSWRRMSTRVVAGASTSRHASATATATASGDAASTSLPSPPAASFDSVLTVRGLSRGFGGLQAVDRLDLDLPQGGLLALIGPNGAGKSTTVNLLSGVLNPSSGSIVLGAIDLAGRSPDAVARAGLVRTFQNGRLFTRLSVLDNVLVGAHARSGSGFWASMLRTPAFRAEERALRDRASGLLDGLGLLDDAQRDVRELPYGKQRKIEIARALVLDPRVLLLDEPAAGLNSGEVEELIAYVARLRARGLSILLIEHNMGLVMRLADRIAVLNFGRLIADGAPDAVRADEAVIEAYLGRRKGRAPAAAKAMHAPV